MAIPDDRSSWSQFSVIGGLIVDEHDELKIDLKVWDGTFNYVMMRMMNVGVSSCCQ